MKKKSNELYRRDELNGLIDVHVVLHGKKKAQELIRLWASTHNLTSWAQLRLYDFLAEKDD